MINFYLIYVFKVKKTSQIIYVGSTRTIGARINEHRRSMREKNREQPIHKYLKSNNLKLIMDVEINIIDTANTKEEALKKESLYFDEYKKTIANTWRAEEREDEKSPVRCPLKISNKEIYFTSKRDAAAKLRVSRYHIAKMIKNKELEVIEIKYIYENQSTGEKFISGYQLQKKYNLDMKTVTKLSKEGEIIINGMKIKKV